MWNYGVGLFLIYPISMTCLLLGTAYLATVVIPSWKRNRSAPASVTHLQDFPGSSKLRLLQIVQTETNASVGLCKRALEEVGYDVAKAIDLLHVTNSTKDGAVLHHGRVFAGTYGDVAVVVEVNCETDFGSRNPMFGMFVNDLCIQIAHTDPKVIARDLIGPALDPLSSIPPPATVDEHNILLNQVSIVADHRGKTIQQVMNDLADRMGERIVIRRFTRYQVGA
jgi:elongation factor Ts